MSKLDDLVDVYYEEGKKHKLGLTKEFLRKVAKGLGPSIYNADASKIAGSDPKELDRIKKNFLMKKLGLKDEKKMDASIAKVIDKLGKGNRKKYRALVYGWLAKHHKKEGVYK